MPPSQYIVEYITAAKARLGPARQDGNRLYWEYTVKWYGYKDPDPKLHHAQEFKDITLSEFWKYADVRTLRPNGLYMHNWEVVPDQSYKDLRILECALNARHEHEVNGGTFDVEAARALLRRRSDFSRLGRYVDAAMQHIRRNEKGARHHVGAPSLTGPTPWPTLQVPVPAEDLNLEEQLLFQEEGDSDDEEEPDYMEFVYQAADEAISRRIETEALDDGLPAFLKHIDFAAHIRPHLAIAKELGLVTLRAGTKRLRRYRSNPKEQECPVANDGETMADVSTECTHFINSASFMNVCRFRQTKEVICPVCRRELKFRPFPLEYFEKPKKSSYTAEVQMSENLAFEEDVAGLFHKKTKRKRRGGKHAKQEAQRKRKREMREEDQGAEGTSSQVPEIA